MGASQRGERLNVARASVVDRFYEPDSIRSRGTAGDMAGAFLQQKLKRRATWMVGGAKCWRKLPRIQVVRDVRRVERTA